MSRSKRDILDTEDMLERLTALLRERGGGDPTAPGPYRCRDDAEALRRISMTLHTWHELECGNARGAIERDEKTGVPYWRNGHTGELSHYPAQDREAGALKRLKKIMARYPALQPARPRRCGWKS